MLRKLLFGNKKDSTAKVAKDRLQIIIAHQRGDGKPAVDMEALEADILQTIKKYIDIDIEDFEITLDDGELDISIDLSKAKEKENEKSPSDDKKAGDTKSKHLNHNKKKR